MTLIESAILAEFYSSSLLLQNQLINLIAKASNIISLTTGLDSVLKTKTMKNDLTGSSPKKDI